MVAELHLLLLFLFLLLLLLLSPDSLAGVSASVSMGMGSGVSDEGEVTSEVSGGVGGEAVVNVVTGGDGCRGSGEAVPSGVGTLGFFLCFEP